MVFSPSANKQVKLYSRDYGFRLSKAHTINDVDPNQMERFLQARRIMCEREGCTKLAVGMSATRLVAYLCDDDLNRAGEIQQELVMPIIKILAFWTEWYMHHEYREKPGSSPGVVVIAPDPSTPILETGIIAASGADLTGRMNLLPTVKLPTRAPSGGVTLPPFMVF
jgi:hypothetical protein